MVRGHKRPPFVHVTGADTTTASSGTQIYRSGTHVDRSDTQIDSSDTTTASSGTQIDRSGTHVDRSDTQTDRSGTNVAHSGTHVAQPATSATAEVVYDRRRGATKSGLANRTQTAYTEDTDTATDHAAALTKAAKKQWNSETNQHERTPTRVHTNSGATGGAVTDTIPSTRRTQILSADALGQNGNEVRSCFPAPGDARDSKGVPLHNR
jgi:hypothetical protein